jgi:hypothetical protein
MFGSLLFRKSYEKLIPLIDFLDGISYEFYIVHGLIINMLTKNIVKEYGVLLYIVITVFISIVAAVGLNSMVKKVNKIAVCRLIKD